MKLRDTLALERTHLANERTLLAYVRTAIMVSVSGVTLLKFFSTNPIAQVSGWLMLLAGVVVVIVGAKRFVRKRKVISGSPPTEHE